MDWTTQVGKAFSADRSAVFGSIQRLRTKARDAGKLKSTPQQDVETRTTTNGQQVIVIEPSNPQIVYVPQYNAQTVYTPTTTSTTVVVKEDDDTAEAVAAGLIGFTAGIALSQGQCPVGLDPRPVPRRRDVALGQTGEVAREPDANRIPAE